LHAAPLTGVGGAGRHIAVTIRLALPARMRAVLTRAHALSDRERQVALLVIEGRPVADIAAALCISPYTVRDHVKAIYRKTRSHTRHQLTARLSGYGPAN
jgi:DNA-binding CsgD family transcriptional regulator